METSSPTSGEKPLIIACTVPPQEEFIKAIAGNETRVLVMVPPGASPHTFEPTPSQISALESADLYIALGSGIEFENQWLDRIRSMYPHLQIVNSSTGLILMPGTEDHHKSEEHEETHEAETTDPHIWMSIKNAKLMVNTTCEALSTHTPSKRIFYETNRNRYLDLLSVVDTKIAGLLSSLPSRTILVYHPAFGYFCRDYNLTQLAVESDGKEPAANSLASLVDRAKSEKISLLFTEPEFSTQGAETLAAEIGARVVLITPLSGEYLTNINHIAEQIAGK
ncbi:MAG: zinc ABC transporter substrate-binding protein [Methanospirillum sp.]|uniref:metal ABC transporter solute-binding protein, Zn/Mn family n=1 Tax=Methanospirillum sp. TaxID=45200 RepID=UPI00236B7D3F|nr:zinc ABC transporter substrate-binding protein [Methanospirillum sp.]MDD1728299.1 zinc ABC transporter substrate-binding protein [Methanospirillum sp.]